MHKGSELDSSKPLNSLRETMSPSSKEGTSSIDLDDADIRDLLHERKAEKSSHLARHWVSLMLLAFLPFGGHFVRNGLSAVNLYLQESEMYDFNNTEYGMILVAQNIANFVLPLVGAFLMQSKWPGIPTLIVIFTISVCIGQSIFIAGIDINNALIAMIGSMIMGSGTGCCVMVQRSMVAQIFQNHRLAFALGVCVAIANSAKTCARISMALIAHWSNGDYIFTLSTELIPCLLSVITGTIYASNWVKDRKQVKRTTTFWRYRSFNFNRLQRRNSESESALTHDGNGSGSAGLEGSMSLNDMALLQGDKWSQDGGDVSTGNAGHYKEYEAIIDVEKEKEEESELMSNDNKRNYDTMSVTSHCSEDSSTGSDITPLPHNTSISTESGGTRWITNIKVPAWFTHLSLIALIVMHAANINSFHLMSQFGPAILNKRNHMDALEAGLTSAITTVLPVLGAPITGLFLDTFNGYATLPVVVTLSACSSIIFYVLLFSDVMPVWPYFLFLSFCEAVLPTAIMALLPRVLSQSDTYQPVSSTPTSPPKTTTTSPGDTVSQYEYTQLQDLSQHGGLPGGEVGGLPTPVTMDCTSSLEMTNMNESNNMKISSAVQSKAGTASNRSSPSLSKTMATTTLTQGQAVIVEEPVPISMENHTRTSHAKLITMHTVFAYVGMGDALMAMIGSVILGMTLDESPKEAHHSDGVFILLAMSILATVLAVMMMVGNAYWHEHQTPQVP